MSAVINCQLPQLNQRWHLQTGSYPVAAEDPVSNCSDIRRRIAYDEELLERVYRGECAPTIRIWRNSQCLVATVKESRMPHFDQASQSLAARGWPVAVRRTGGSCVPHGPGVINLALVYPRPSNQHWQHQESYQFLCALFKALLTEYGVTATTGLVPGSFCDGSYNLQVNGQKLVGTAQRWKGGMQPDAKGAILVHGCLLSDVDLLVATENINSLYRLCGQEQQFLPEKCVTLRQCVSGPTEGFSRHFVDEVIERLTGVVDANLLDSC